jgi:hypothetical protein
MVLFLIIYASIGAVMGTQFLNMEDNWKLFTKSLEDRHIHPRDTGLHYFLHVLAWGICWPVFMLRNPLMI